MKWSTNDEFMIAIVLTSKRLKNTAPMINAVEKLAKNILYEVLILCNDNVYVMQPSSHTLHNGVMLRTKSNKRQESCFYYK